MNNTVKYHSEVVREKAEKLGSASKTLLVTIAKTIYERDMSRTERNEFLKLMFQTQRLFTYEQDFREFLGVFETDYELSLIK